MKIYRFTIEAFEEIDIKANNLVEAQGKADGAWNETFGGKDCSVGPNLKV